MSGDEPLRGFGERIVSRARLPLAVLFALPIVVLAIEYFFFLLGQKGLSVTDSLHDIKEAVALFAGLAALPPIILAFCRELQVHELLDKMLGVRKDTDIEIRRLLKKLAVDSGYGHSTRIDESPEKAREWFYSYANSQSVLRAYAFELWEAYYVGLYLSLASAISFVVLFGLALLFQDRISWLFAAFCGLLFLAQWAVRHCSTVPKILKLPGQQIGEIKPSGEILTEAKRRFG